MNVSTNGKNRLALATKQRIATPRSTINLINIESNLVEQDIDTN